MGPNLTSEDLPQLPRQALETRAIVACGGKYTLCYLPERDEWKRLADGLSDNRSCRSKMINYRDQLYNIFPRHGKAERYDPVYDGWSTLNTVLFNYGIVTVVRGEIYATEVDKYAKKSTIARYDVERCSWQKVLSSPEGCREEACIVSSGNHLYVLGGKLPQESHYVTKAERFDTVGHYWERIADMQDVEGYDTGVASQGKIFVAGDRNYWSKCEMYNISTNKWQSIRRLNVPRRFGIMVCLKGTLYVLGGTNIYGQSELSVECYDPRQNKWIEKTTIPVKKISEKSNDTFAGCALKLSKGVLDKACVV